MSGVDVSCALVFGVCFVVQDLRVSFPVRCEYKVLKLMTIMF